MNEQEKKRAMSIANNIRDKLNAIQSELVSSYQSSKYLLEKVEPIIWDASVLKNMFKDLEKMENMKGEENDAN